MDDFGSNQRNRYIYGINRAIPIINNSTPELTNSNTIAAALGTYSNGNGNGNGIRADQFFEKIDESTAMGRDAACRSLPYPSPAMRDPSSRTGCGWWFHSDPAIPSMGAYGTRRGPMNAPQTNGNGNAGEWIWNPEDAFERESQKQTLRIKSCSDIQYSPLSSSSSSMGWCTSTGRALVTDGKGNPLFPRMPGGDCPSPGQIITDPTQCPPPSSSSGSNGNGNGSVSAICTPSANGTLSSACLQSLVPWAGCSSNGTLAQSLGGSSYAGSSPLFQSPYAALQRRGFTLHSGIVNDGQVSVQTALQSIGSLKQQTGGGNDPTGAAGNLCYGTTFDPCAGPQSAPFDPICIDRQLDSAGYAPNAGLRPSQVGMDYWNQALFGSWDGLLKNIQWWKTAADTDTSDPTTQASAIQNVYGVAVQFPKVGCNYNGISILRYGFPTTDPSLFGAYPSGAQTHFLGRMLQTTSGLQGAGIQQQNSSSEVLPGTGSMTEGNRHLTVFRPSLGGTYQFQISYDDIFRLVILDGKGNTIVTGGGNNLQRGGTQITTPVQLIPDQSYTVIYDTWNVVPWTKLFQMNVNGGGWQQIPTQQLYLMADRRQPLLELAFHRLPAGTSGPITDTQGILQNWFLNSPTGTVSGQPCLVVAGHGSYCGNWNKYSQGIRLRALKTLTMKLFVKSGSVSFPNRVPPTLFSMYNLPSTNTAGPLRVGAPTDSWNWINRTADFSLMTSGSNVYPYGTSQKGGGDVIQETFLYNASTSAPMIPLDRWFHLAYVWADDMSSYAIYLDGKLMVNLPAAQYDPALILEQIRIGCDSTDDMASWQGGVAWFRGFDYRLSGDLIQRDMNDSWDTLV